MVLVVFSDDGQLNEIGHHLRGMAHGVPFQLITKLETALDAAFADTQAKTHVITGSLKSSGKVSSDYHAGEWNGTIEYGGESSGPNNPVEYAIYEMARGGSHDFYRDMPDFEPRFQEAIEDWLGNMYG